ncbi:MAG TPA: hypothetical protein ENK26_09385 [Gammaproteobacteria bacterium]|nr:hypothetical protein [Gammaproteobacteria bacterium]
MHPFKAVSYQRQQRNENRQFKKRNGNGHASGDSRPNQNRYRKDPRINYHVYGKGSAIEFFCDETKKQHIKTISINAASARKDIDKGYDWENKTFLQLPRNELLKVTAVLLGLSEHCEFRQNSTHTSKSYKVEFQGSKVFFMVMERGKAIRAVGLSPEDTYQVATLFLRQLKENSPWMTVDEIIQMIEITIVNMGQAPSVELDEKYENPVDILDDSIPEEELLEKEPNFNF